jgi:hypothetical protein
VAERQFIEVFAQNPIEHDKGIARPWPISVSKRPISRPFHARLREAGCAPDPIKLGCDQTQQFWVRDPHGLNLEFQEYTDRSAQFRGGTVEVDW